MKKNILDFYHSLLDIHKNHLDFSAPALKFQVRNFQHERLIHLLITLFFGLLFIFFAFVCYIIVALSPFTLGHFCLFLLTAIITILEIFYIKHYFVLENTLQKIQTLATQLLSAQKNPKTDIINP